jgi:hypothetical protein
MSDLKVNEIKTDTIKDQTGTTAMTIDSTGRVTTPARPAFFAHGTSYSWVESQNAGTVVTLAGTKFNIGNHFNTSNYRFTAPVAGVYQFNATGYVQQANNAGALAIALNGTIVHHTNSGYPLVHFYSQNSASYDNAAGFGTCLQLSVDDYVTLVVAYNNTDFFPGMCHLSGFLVG